MKNRFILILLLIGFASVMNAAQDAEKSALDALDKALAHQQTYMNLKYAEIDSLKQELERFR